ncbi:MAG: HAD-IA family hydrolase [Oscillospiraceae bacterium]|nr:HAD-IA family hydrolase [Oscillospiraceae bacterium]
MKIGVLFDLDGTLLDTLEDLMDATNAALAQFGYPPRTLEEIRRFVGNGAARLIQLAVPEGAATEPVLAAFQQYYRTHCQGRTAPYAGVVEAIQRLDMPMAIVSNKPDVAVKALCEKYFSGVYALGESADCPRKPAPDMVRKAMAVIGVERCVYVGDSEVDVATARNAGVPCLSVLWGFRDEAQLRAAGATHFCRRPEDLPTLIRDLTAQ